MRVDDSPQLRPMRLLTPPATGGDQRIIMSFSKPAVKAYARRCDQQEDDLDIGFQTRTKLMMLVVTKQAIEQMPIIINIAYEHSAR